MKTTVSVPRGGESALVVLFAEDDADTRALYDAYFSGCGIIPEFAADGCEALAKAIDLHPDVVVLDITLPYLDGFDVCRAIKRDRATSAIPVIAATGYWRPDTDAQAAAAGFEAFLLKPYAPERLLDEIWRWAPATSRRSSRACPLRTPSLRSESHTRAPRR